MDAIQVLIAQHRTIEGLFEQVGNETGHRTRASAVSRLAEELIVHMAAEEAVFYAAARRVLHEGENVTDQDRSERLLLRVELRRVLETSTANAFLRERVEALRASFTRHVREEENGLFPRVAGALSEAQLEGLGAEILASRPPVWIITPESRALVHLGDERALRSRVTLPIRPPQGG